MAPAFAVWLCSAVWLGVAPALVSLLGILQWKSLPFPESNRIVQINAGLSVAQALSGSAPFAAISAFDASWLVVEGPSGSTAVVNTSVEDSFFQVFDIRASSGRVFSPGSESTEVGTAILTESLSRRLFGRSRESIGAVFRAGGRELEVLGVVPDEPVFPPGAQIWMLRAAGLRGDPSFVPAEVAKAGIVGRIAPSSSLEAADALMRRTVLEMEQRDKVLHGDVELLPLDRILRRRSGGERGILAISLAGILVFVALAFSSALAGYLVEKRTDFAIRLALGAQRRDLARHLFARIALLSLPGLVTGLPLGVWTLKRLAHFVPPTLGALLAPRLDAGSLLLCAAGWQLVVVAGTAVAWLSSRQLGLCSLFSGDGPGMISPRRAGRARLALVCGALAVAMALGAVTETLRRSLATLEREPLGFEPRGAISAVVRFPRSSSRASLNARLAPLISRLESLPGVEAVALSDSQVFGGARFLEASTPGHSRFWMARVQRIHGHYLQASGLRLVAGRALTALELEAGSSVALLDQTGAQRMFPDGSALGRTLVAGNDQVEIVGLVSTAKSAALDETVRPQLYLPLLLGSQAAGPEALALSLRVREPVSEQALTEAVAKAGAAVSQIRPIAEDVRASLAPRRLARNMVLVVSGAILLLVTLTTFATFSWLLELRAKELAVRQALGETPGGLARRALQGALWLTATAAVLGLALYLPATRALRGFVFGMAVLSPGILLESFLGIGGLALAATAVAAGLTLRRQVTNLPRLLGQP